jgi:hypothetical protein
LAADKDKATARGQADLPPRFGREKISRFTPHTTAEGDDGMPRRRTVSTAAALAVLIGLLISPVSRLSLVSTTGAQPQLPSCGWPFDVNAQELNIAYPDTHTNYWVQPYTMDASGEVVIQGSYAFARYFSFVTYTADGQPIGESVHDNEIVPDAGSVNPFTTFPAPTDPNQRKYTVRVTPTTPPPGQTNVLPGLPQGTASGTGYLIYRLYVPDNPNDPKAGVALPSVTVNGAPLTTCTDAEQRVLDRVLAANVSINGADPSTFELSPSLWRRSPNLGGLFANPDNQYVIAATQWAPGRLVVVRGKAPTFPNTGDPVNQPVTTPTQLRYWSFCSNELQDPFPAVLCQADAETALDPNGYYTYVVSVPQDRPANAIAANGVTWLPWEIRTTATYPTSVVNGFLILRNMLPATTFTQAIQDVPAPSTGPTADQLAAQAKSVMGAYYPMGVYCDKAVFEAGGAAACFNPTAPTATPPPTKRVSLVG